MIGIKEDDAMKKNIITLAAIAAAFSMVSCNKEIATPEGNPAIGAKTVIFASTEDGMTRTALEGNDTNGYNVVWTEGDSFKIGAETFILTGGEGTTRGTFEGAVPADGDYTVYYPSTYNGTDWPASQTYAEGNIAGSPMKAEVTIADGKSTGTMEFKNEGGILRLTLKLKEGDAARSVKKIVLSSSQLDEDIELSCATAVELTEEGVPFHIALPAQDYADMQMTIYDDGSYKCVRSLGTGKTLTVERSLITPVSLTAKSWEFFGLCFTAAEASTVSLSNNGGALEYSLNDGEWTEWANKTPISMATNDKVYLRLNIGKTWGNNGGFSMTGSLAASGNIMSLVDRTGLSKVIPFESCFEMLFMNCISLTSAPELPATTLTDYCYFDMFYKCSSLTTAPELPATTLANRCYDLMFADCSSLTTAPELPAMTLAEYCYASMFYKCTSLATAPVLRAPTLTNHCYDGMFDGCKKIKSVTCLATDISATGCLDGWLQGAANAGTIYVAKGMSGSWAAPSRWKIVEIE